MTLAQSEGLSDGRPTILCDRNIGFVDIAMNLQYTVQPYCLPV